MSVSMEWQPKFTIEEIHAFSDEQIRNMDLQNMLDVHVCAVHYGEDELASRFISFIPLAPESLLAAKETYGAEYIRKRNFNTIRADEKYGKNWLDR